MRIAVTGATGFVGGAIVRRLASRGHDVLATGRATDRPLLPSDVRYAAWDLAADGPGAAPAGIATAEAVVHAAAHVAGWGDEETFQAVTVGGTARVLDVLGETARLIVIGSSSVYVPDGRSGPYREVDGPVARARYHGAYARAKADQERLLAARRPGAIILRPRAVWGPGDRTLLPRVEARVRAGRLPLPDGGRHPMSTTHIESLVDAVEAALAHPDVQGPVNVADATPRRPVELLEALFAARGEPIRVMAVPGRLAQGAATALETIYRLAGARREPPITRYAIESLSAPVVLELSRLHSELEIRPDTDLAARARELAGVRAEGLAAAHDATGG